MVQKGILNAQEKFQLQQILARSSRLKTATERSEFLVLCDLEEYCSSIKLDQSPADFAMSIIASLSRTYITDENYERLGLSIFLEYISQFDSNFPEEDKKFIQYIITQCESRQQNSNLRIDAEFKNIVIELDDIIINLKQDIIKIKLDKANTLGFNNIIYKSLEQITAKTKKLFLADRTTIYFLNETEKLSSIIVEGSESLEIRLQLGEGVAGQVAKDKKARRSNIDECNNSLETQKQYKRTGYRTYTLLTYPLLNDKKDIVAVIQLVNKLRNLDNVAVTLEEKIDKDGFTEKDEKLLEKFTYQIRPVLEEFQSFYKIAQKFQEVIRFTQVMQDLSQKCHDLEDTRQLIMRVAREFMDADRTTLWLPSNQATELWATFPSKDGALQEKIVPVGEGYVGKAAKTHQFINIPFDLYDDSGSVKSKETDRETGYRTCSLMCMPVLSLDQELVGVLQLINKRKPGVPINYSLQEEEDLEKNPPECFQDSFTQEDEKRMQALNNHIANAILKIKESSGDREDDRLYKVLNDITEIARDRLYADRATIFLLDQEKQELWSIIKDEKKNTLEITVPVGQGIVGEVAKTQKIVNVKDLYSDSRSDVAKEKDQQTGYHTYSILAIPLVNKQKKLLAVVEFINKLKIPRYRQHELSKRIDNKGFSEIDPKIFDDFHPIILGFIEAFRDFHAAVRRQQRESKLKEAIHLVIQSPSDANNEVFICIRDAAEKLVNADRSTLWILNRESNELWAEIPDNFGNPTRQTVPLGKGYVGKAAETCEFLNIPFDLYEDSASQTSRDFDQNNGYRTCSLICMPIRNSDSDLVGVIQLVNKRRAGSFPKYDPKDWPKAPECFKASFTKEDINILNAFNSTAGNRLYAVELLDEMLHKAKRLEDDLYNGNEIPRS